MHNLYDIGSGNGWLTSKLFNKSVNVSALDCNSNELFYNKAKTKLLCDIYEASIDFSKPSFYFFSSVLQVVSNPMDLIKFYSSKAFSGSVFIFIVPCDYPFYRNIISASNDVSTVDDYVKMINSVYSIIGPGIITNFEMINLIENSGLKLVSINPALGYFSSCLYELILYIRVKYKFKIWNPVVLLISIVSIILDGLMPINSKVSEFIFVCEKK